MHNERDVAPGPGLHITSVDNRIVKVTSATGRTIGHAINGQLDGPGLLVAWVGADASVIFERILRLPGLRSVRGRLVLLYLDRLDDTGTFAELDSVAALLRRISDTLMLSAIALDDAIRGQAQTDELFQTVLRFGAKNGMELPGVRRGSRICRDQAT